MKCNANLLIHLCAIFALATLGLACSGPDGDSSGDPHNDAAHEAVPEAGIAVPPNVRKNLGITFVEVERRQVKETRRLPGMFESRPEARHEYRAMLAGSVELLVRQFQSVEEGDLLLTIDSPRWREVQHEAVEAEGEISMAKSRLEVAKARLDEASAMLTNVNERVANLVSAGARRAELEAQSIELENSLPRLRAELNVQEAAVEEALEHFQSRLRTLASISGFSVEELLEATEDADKWQAISLIEVRANGAGVVESLSVNNGGWLNEGSLALTTVDPTAIRFHAEAPQSDIALYRDGQAARIVPSQGGSLDLQAGIDGTVTLSVSAHSVDRTFPIYVEDLAEQPPWARDGVTAFLEVTLTKGNRKFWAIPLSSVMQDGLDHVFYRRNPDNPDRVLRVEADLGDNDGRWVAVKSGLAKGDEVVLDGAYALKLSDGGQQQAPPGYHYHADGSLHKDH